MVRITASEDGTDREYHTSLNLDRACEVAYAISVVTGISLVVPQIAESPAIEGVALFQVLAVLACVLLGAVDDVSFWYRAERKNRAYAFKDALGADVADTSCPQGYYSNGLPQSCARYAADIMESAFYTKAISYRMISREAIITAIALGLLIAIFCCGPTALLWPIALQTVMSAHCVIGCVNCIVFFNRVDYLYRGLYRLLVSEGIGTKEQLAEAVFLAQEYEVVKAHYKVRLSTKVFNTNKDSLDAKWQVISRKIKASPNIQL